jgi:LysM repeat protein
MKIFKVLFLVILFVSCNAFAKQDPYLKHTVVKGETLYQIAKKYQVTLFDIYRLNPDAKNGIEENAILLIPKTTAVTQVASKTKDLIHVVKSKETLYSIAKEYEVTQDQIKNWNKELLENGLQPNQELVVGKLQADDTSYVEVETIKNKTETFSHKVLAGETLYSLSKKYSISENELLTLNPSIKEGLQVGDIITIKKTNATAITAVNDIHSLYTVKPKETLYSLLKNLNISREDLFKLNPDLSEGLKEGMVLKLPTMKTVRDTVYSMNTKVELVTTLDKTKRKNLFLLIPFNMSKIESDSSRTVREQISKSSFLNITLDFYAGAMMAIDSAKVLGLPVNIKILDVESIKNSSNVAAIIAKNNISKADAVIGPLQYSQVEITADLLSAYNVPVISPLSKEIGKAIPNLYYSVPSEDILMNKLFMYFKEKEGNVVAVVSPKKASTTTFLTTRYPDVKFVGTIENGVLDIANIKSLLVKGKKNFVILDSEKASHIISTTNTLIKLKSEYDIQLVVLELYETLNFEEIKMSNLTSLNMMFPSTRKTAETANDKIFIKKFKAKNKVAPNAIVSRGFDVTFDTLLRLCQEEGFTSSLSSMTEYFENSFNYVNDKGKNINNAVYLMQYEEDLTIKQVK